MYKYYLGIKYLLSRPVNILSLFGVTLSVWALIVIVGIFTGFIRDVHKHIRGATSDLSLIHFGASARSDLAQVSTLLAQEKTVVAFAPKLSWFGLLSVEGREEKPVPNAEINPIQKVDKDLAQIVGIDFEREIQVTDLASWLAAVKSPTLRVADQDHPFACSTANGVKNAGLLLGKNRAEQLGLQKGMNLILIMPKEDRDGSGPMSKRRFVFNGAYSSSHHLFDQSTVFVDLSQMQEIMGAGIPKELPKEGRKLLYNEIAIKLEKGSDNVAVRDELNEALGRLRLAPGRFATWQERHKNFLMNVEHQSQLMKIVLFVLVIVAAFLIFATLSNMVSEKTRDIGILSAMGASRSGILIIFSSCGLFLALLGCSMGMLFAWFTCTHLNDINHWLEQTFDIELFKVSVYGLKEIPYDINPMWLLTVSSVTTGLAILSSLVPGLRAARMDPVEALRYE